MDNPDPVNRVTPPRITWITNIQTPNIIQLATGREEKKEVETIRIARKGSIRRNAAVIPDKLYKAYQINPPCFLSKMVTQTNIPEKMLG